MKINAKKIDDEQNINVLSKDRIRANFLGMQPAQSDRVPLLVACSAVAILKFGIIFEGGASHIT